MRRFSILILLIASAVTLRAASYEAHSPHYSLAMEVVPLGADDVRYDIKITDVVTGEVLVSPKLPAKRGESTGGEAHVRDLHLFFHVSDGARLMASVEIQRGGDVIDSIEAYWATRPQLGNSTSDDAPLRVGGDVKAPVVIDRVEPVYSEEARKARISGIVILEVVIGRDGLVKKAYVLKPLPFGLDQAAVDAVKQWRFKPGTLDGKPVDVIFNLTVNFKLGTPPPPSPPPD